MEKSCIERRIATRCRIDGLPNTDSRAIHAVDSRETLYYAKTAKCPKRRGEQNPTWLGNELIYYYVAKLSGLKMPYSCILEVDNELAWGSEYQVGRDPIFESVKDGGLVLAKTCNSSRIETLSLARSLLLDLALLNSDRQPWNILISGPEHQKELWFFDHDKSLLGDGREDGDLWRIHVEYDFEQKISDYFACATANQLVFNSLTDREICAIFESLALNPESLRSAFASCPSHWLAASLLSDLERFLLKWWKFIAEKLQQPRNYLKQRLLLG